MIIEATRQLTINGEPSKARANDKIHLSNVEFLSELVLSKETISLLEIFTTLHPISVASNPNRSWEFSITSYNNGLIITHATGTTASRRDVPPTEVDYSWPEGTLESSAPRIWYKKFVNKGLELGSEFQVIKDLSVSRLRNQHICYAQATSNPDFDQEYSIMHPVTIEAMITASMVALTAGEISNLTPRTVSRIGSAIIPLTFDPSDDEKSWSIIANGMAVALGCARANVELTGYNDQMMVRIEDIRLVPLMGNPKIDSENQRHPISRVIWRPDPGLMTNEGLTTYLQNAAKKGPLDDDFFGEAVQNLMACISIIGHKNPHLRVLELGNGSSWFTQAVMETLSSNTDFPLLRSYTTGNFKPDCQLSGSIVDLKTGECETPRDIPSDTLFDLILIPDYLSAAYHLKNSPQMLSSRLDAGGVIISVCSRGSKISLDGTDLACIQSQGRRSGLMLIRRDQEIRISSQNATSVLVVEQTSTTLGDLIIEEATSIAGQPAKRVLFDDITSESILPGSTVISLIEVEKPLLSTASEVEFDKIKTLINKAASHIWVTGGSLLNGQFPDHSLASSLFRSVMLEQPSLKIFSFDIDDVSAKPKITAKNILSLLEQQRLPNVGDTEYCEREGVIHISRIVPDASLNEIFRQAQGENSTHMSLEKIKCAELCLKAPNDFDGIVFKAAQLPEPSAHEVQIAVKSAGLNSEDFQLTGELQRELTCLHEFTGIVEKIGSEVTDLVIGDRVYVMAPSSFRTVQIVPQWACQKLDNSEAINLFSTLPFVYAMAIYALDKKAGLQEGETVLIHSGASTIGQAAIQLAQLRGARVFTTVDTAEQGKSLTNALKIPSNNILDLHSDSFERDFMLATNGLGADVIINSAPEDLPSQVRWKCCSPWGRFIEIGTRTSKFSRSQHLASEAMENITYIKISFSELYDSPNPTHHRIWTDLIKRVFSLYCEGKIREFPVENFDIENLVDALKRHKSNDSARKIAVNLESGGSMLKVECPRYRTRFSDTKSYLLIGCLGGLGRSLTRWMFEQGARKFVFLGRSGIKKMPARLLVEDLTSLGANCTVVEGDVCSMGDVEKMVESADGPIGGVVQAAMCMKPALFSLMDSETWHDGIDPKVKGTWNLHNALTGKDSSLDFFLCTGSISGTVGLAAEGNYCAGNHFLDNFARYRRSLGLPATTVGLGLISEVGAIHENPDAEALLLRKGFSQLTESEVLTIIDISLSQSPPISTITSDTGNAAAAHILTGIEPSDNNNPAFMSPRFSILARAQEQEGRVNVAAESNGLPAEITKARDSGVDLVKAIANYLAKEFGRMVLLPADKVNLTKPLDSFGMDSMLAADFRSWLYQTFKIDISYDELLSKTTTLANLSTTVSTAVET
ncbi:hypothetical protein ABW21_db0202636 [Orbilia brochopaga]|nr:hypothetical protein ABW21_db0202636 [Drechslerella brochopaga]